MNRFAIIVAGGTGQRMKSVIPKQFMPLNGEPVLAHTLRKFADCHIVLVLPEAHITTWEVMTKDKYQLPAHQIVAGGKTRAESVRNGLLTIRDEQGLVAVHDAVRPLVSKELIEKCFESAAQSGSGVAAVRLKETIRYVDEESGENYAVDRNDFWAMQTPQVFDIKLLRRAFENAPDLKATDDATLVENLGHRITLIEGSYQNLKITTPEDLRLAEILMA